MKDVRRRYINPRRPMTTHVSTPDVGLQYLVFLVQVEDLYQGQAVVDLDRLRVVQHGTTDDAERLVLLQQRLDEALLVRHRHRLCNGLTVPCQCQLHASKVRRWLCGRVPDLLIGRLRVRISAGATSHRGPLSLPSSGVGK